MSVDITPLDIICLHGFSQNSQILKKKLSNLIKSNQNIKLHYLDGFVSLPSETNDAKAYWIYSKENPLDVTWTNHYDNSIYYLEDSFNSFIELGNKIGKVDGIIGFSQGGFFADYICKMHAIGNVPFDIKFSIFISAGNFTRPGYEFDIQPSIETLHIIGEKDSIIPLELSKELSECYLNKEVFIHKGSHVIPSNSAAKNVVRNLLSKVQVDVSNVDVSNEKCDH